MSGDVRSAGAQAVRCKESTLQDTWEADEEAEIEEARNQYAVILVDTVGIGDGCHTDLQLKGGHESAIRPGLALIESTTRYSASVPTIVDGRAAAW